MVVVVVVVVVLVEVAFQSQILVKMYPLPSIHPIHHPVPSHPITLVQRWWMDGQMDGGRSFPPPPRSRTRTRTQAHNVAITLMIHMRSLKVV